MFKITNLTFYVSGCRNVCHDDQYFLSLASETGAIVVSNNNYRELVHEKPEFKEVIEEKILMSTGYNSDEIIRILSYTLQWFENNF